MKYLSQNHMVAERLPMPGASWHMLDFFFDFRQAGNIGNSIEGLLRCLLHQLSYCSSRISKIVNSAILSDPAITVEKMKRLLRQALGLDDQSFYILIDGLDEFSNHSSDLVELLQLLLTFENRGNVKLCLASRPEPAILFALAEFPALDMAAHNRRGIERFIANATAKFQPHLDRLQLPSIRRILLDRAEGVFLWVNFAVRSIMVACIEGATVDEIEKALNELPQKLEEMYERIIQCIPLGKIPEAAMLYTLVSTASEGPITLELLHSTYCFLSQGLALTSLPRKLIDIEHFERRLAATTGGLLEVVRAHTGSNSHDSKNVQLIHETVRSFSERTQWHNTGLPSDFGQVLPNPVWPRLVSMVLLDADAREGIMARQIYSALLNVRAGGKEFHGKTIPYPTFLEVFSAHNKGRDLCTWALLLYHCMFVISYEAQECEGDARVGHLLETAARSRFASIHFVVAHIGNGQPELPQELLTSQTCDLTLAAAHGRFRYLEKMQDRLRSLTDSARDNLVSIMIRDRVEVRRLCHNLYAPQDQNHENLRRIVDLILTHNTTFSDYHLSVMVRLGYEKIPAYFLSSMSQDLKRLQDTLRNRSNAPGVPLFVQEPALFIWACDSPSSLPNVKAEAQLQILLTLGLNINYRDQNRINVIHYLIHHFVIHTFLEDNNRLGCMPNDDLVEGVEKLYLVERAGADFTHQCRYRTPLQALRFGFDRVRKTPPDRRNFEILLENRMAHLEYAFEHKEQTGHLPQPYVGRMPPSKNLELRCDICAGRQGNFLDQTLDQSSQIALPEAFINPRPPPPVPQLQTPNVSYTCIQSENLPNPFLSTTRSSTIAPTDSTTQTLPTPPRTFTSTSPASSRPHRRSSRSSQSSLSPGYMQPTQSSRQRQKSPSENVKRLHG